MLEEFHGIETSDICRLISAILQNTPHKSFRRIRNREKHMMDEIEINTIKVRLANSAMYYDYI